MTSTCMIITRQISTSSVCYGKRNFRKFLLYNKRGSRAFKEERHSNPNPEFPIDTRGVRLTGAYVKGKWVNIPEMIPEIIVPSLKDFKLKPYVSYNVKDVKNHEFTAKSLFNIIYADKIRADFESNKLGPNGEPLEPSEEEKLTPTEAKLRADQTGTDIFSEGTPYP